MLAFRAFSIGQSSLCALPEILYLTPVIALQILTAAGVSIIEVSKETINASGTLLSHAIRNGGVIPTLINENVSDNTIAIIRQTGIFEMTTYFNSPRLE